MTPYNNYNKRLKQFARNLRNQSSKAEIILWSRVLRNRSIMGYQFLRQRPIDKFIVDFFCKELKLVIEVDGLTHTFEENFEKEFNRQKRLEDLGYVVIRFSDDEVLNHRDNVLRTLSGYIEIQEELHPELIELKKRKYKSEQ